ncbi:hypothetical protein HN51_018622 [Arachis hypogaea]|uniref:DOG1 domain-containing protein n=2 Tax=Arachis TaxID=3817 RepID=A0A445BTY5_ARAHY|nr:protein ZW2 [Arachis duranensis]XP_025611696.1 protein DOG1-like 4 [Arachis hypogaea]QHO30244.1 uncharacterized protein DS421_8g231570 [Arachis hypogaea]RYR42179.1 hypothetical protein Ahy_A08g038648 [Arachis hypogaea]
MPTNSQQQFHAFYEGWIQRKQTLLDELLTLSDAPDSQHKHIALIESVLSHYQQYFEHKTRLQNDDVLLLFSPTWLSTYERALLWMGDYKPSIILRLADTALQDLTPDQIRAIERVRAETRTGERELSAAMAAFQESVASPRVLQRVRRVGRLLDGEIDELDESMGGMRNAVGELFQRADELRVATVRKVVAVLSPPKTVRFLAAALGFQLRVRRWGMERDQSR